MKRLILTMALIALTLWGCGADKPDATGGDDTAPETMNVPVTAGAPGLYDPNFQISGETYGAVRAYPLEDPCSGMLPMGEDILLFSAGEWSTVISRLTGENLSTAAQTEVDCQIVSSQIVPNGGSVLVREDGILFYDEEDHAMVVLNGQLQETSRIKMPEEMDGLPVLAADGNTVYYTADDQIRELDFQSGISRLLREEPGRRITLAGLYCGGTVLGVYAEDLAGQELYISTDNGAVLHTGGAVRTLTTWEDTFYAELGTEGAGELLFGQIGGQVQALEPAGMLSWTQWLPERHAAVSCAIVDGSWTLDYYDLATGNRTASVTMADTCTAWTAMADPSGEYVWFLTYYGETGREVLFRWDLAKSALGDAEDYTGRRYTADDPDVVGINALKAEAHEIGGRYGVEILLWDEAVAVQPWDYILESEHRVSAMEDALKILDGVLARFPEGFFQTAAETSDLGAIQIALVGSINGDPQQGTLDSPEGLQFWNNSDPYIALDLTAGLEQNFYHELFHVIESRVLGNTTIYDNWNSLNPKGFEYDYDYITNQQRTDATYLEGENRAFIDFYSMSFPKEDRARLMEYAMLDGMEETFASDRMQRKLSRLCLGIRKAFGLSGYVEVLPWEQYLETPLAPS